MTKIAVVITHPIQYYAPLFKLISSGKLIQLKVFYTWKFEEKGFDKDFNKLIQWDIPLLDGYEFEFVKNTGHKKNDFWTYRNPELIKKIILFKPDAILVYGWNYFSHFNVMRYFKGKIPVIFRGDSTLLDAKQEIRFKFYLKKIILKKVYSYVDLALYVGENNKKYFKEFGLKDNQLIFIPHAVDNDRFYYCSDDQKKWVNRIKENFNIKNGDITIVFCGKFIKKKNPQLLINAIKKLNYSYLHLIVVGNGQLEEELKEISIGNENIHFLPFQNQSIMPAVYRLGEIFCLPSSGPEETWGLSINEAMACGRAIIVSDKAGCAIDLVKDGYNGYIFKSNDINDLIDKINILNDRNLLDKMMSNSSKIISNWSYSCYIKLFYNIFKT